MKLEKLKQKITYGIFIKIDQNKFGISTVKLIISEWKQKGLVRKYI